METLSGKSKQTDKQKNNKTAELFLEYMILKKEVVELGG